MKPAPEDLSERTILIVDDDPCLRDLLRLHLSNAGYSVVLAEDAVTAGRFLLRFRPDLLLVDVDMPFMNGFELVSAIRSDRRFSGLPVIFLSANAAGRQRGLALGALEYLTKPVLADRLLAAIARHVGGGPLPIG